MMRRLIRSCLTGSAAIALCGLSGIASAQSSSAGNKDWTGYAGVGPIVFPKYTGSKGSETFLAPLLMFEYKETVYVDLVRAGVRIWSSADKKMALGLAAEPRFGFKASDAPSSLAWRRGVTALRPGPASNGRLPT